MLNKLINHLLLLANVLFIFGLALTIIFINLNQPWIEINLSDLNDVNQSVVISDINKNKVLECFTPFIISTFLATTSAAIFAYQRLKYYVLISCHIEKRTRNLFKVSVYLLFFNLLLAIILMFSGLSMLDTNYFFFKNYYLYIILGVEMFLTLIDVFLDALAKLKVKVDLANARANNEILLEGKNDGKYEQEKN